MENYLSKDIVNNGRQKELDLAKGIAIILMVLCHAGIYYYPKGSIGYDISDLLGGEFAAPVFMVCLGIGVVYSKHNEVKDLVRRGIITILFGYLLNFMRAVVPYLIAAIVKRPYNLNGIFDSLMNVDIMGFAGMAFLTLALFKKLKLNPAQQFMIGLLAAGLGEILTWKSLGNRFLDAIFGLIWGTYEFSFFPLLNWLVFPCAGVLFGNILLHTSDKSKLYKSIFPIGLIGVILAYYQIFTDPYAYYNNQSYYFMGLKNVIFALCFPITLFSICQYIADKTVIEDLPVVGFCSKYLNTIYCVSWVIILWSRYICYGLLNLSLSDLVINIIMILILIVSYFVTRLYVAIKAKKQKV